MALDLDVGGGRKHIYGCQDAIKDFGLKDECCNSCHYELEDGYSYLTWIDDTDKYYEICCTVRMNYDTREGNELKLPYIMNRRGSLK